VEITKSQKRLFILLGIIVLYGIYDIIANYDTYSSFYTSDKPKAAVTAAKKDTVKTAVVQNEIEYTAGWGKDPFYKVIVQRTAKKKVKRNFAPKLQLYAISYKGAQSAALINDNFLKVGAMVSGFRLQKIEKNRVTLSDGKKTITLKLVNY